MAYLVRVYVINLITVQLENIKREKEEDDRIQEIGSLQGQEGQEEIKKSHNLRDILIFFAVMIGMSIIGLQGEGETSNSISPTPPDTNPIVNCTFEKCGTKQMTRTECSQAVCCPSPAPGGGSIIVKNKESCTAIQLKILELMSGQNTQVPQYESGYDAGYEWASENDIDSISNCDGNSDSFNEGCIDYVCGMAEEYPRDYECF